MRPVLPGKMRGVPRVDDSRVFNGISWVWTLILADFEISRA